jgi:hypothetical protein
VKRLLGNLEKQVVGVRTLQALRAIQVLEQIGTSEAKELLAALAGGAPEARITQEAMSCLQRLSKLD